MVFFNQSPQAALDIDREVEKELFVLPINDGFEEFANGAFGDFIVERKEEVTMAANVGPVELRVVERAGEALIIPDEQASLGLLSCAQVVHHFVEAITGNDRRARAGQVFENAGQDQAMVDAPGGDGSLLLRDREVLIVAA